MRPEKEPPRRNREIRAPGTHMGQEQCLSPAVRMEKLIIHWAETILKRNYIALMDSQVAPEVKNPPANTGEARDNRPIPGLEGSPGERKGNHSNILAWKTPWTEEPGGLQSMGLQRVKHN